MILVGVLLILGAAWRVSLILRGVPITPLHHILTIMLFVVALTLVLSLVK